MMKSILIIMGNHSPEPSSVANCAEPLIKKLVNAGFKIDIVTNRKKITIPIYERLNGVDIYRIDDCRIMNNDLLRDHQQIESTKALKEITRLLAFILKGCYYIRLCLFAKEKRYAGWQEKKVVAKCVELHGKRKYDAIISVSQPFISHYIAKRFFQLVKGPIKWFMFEFDPFSYNEEVIKSAGKRKKLFKDEYKMFQLCDKIFLTQELYRFYKNTPFNVFLEKAVPVPFANMQPVQYEKEIAKEIKFNREKINCIFIGRLYEDIRNPAYALQLFSQLNDDIHFILMTNFSQEKIKKNIAGHGDKFSIYPIQTRDTAFNALMNSDILINIGNTVEFQVPAKIFEYMSTGKPIVHFSKFSNDPALVYLEKYPTVLIINEWEGNMHKQATQLNKFCKEYCGSIISYEQVCGALSGLDGESVSNRFADTIVDLLGEQKSL
jgi:glycosyltransferase involved in cell wall biosynthesis